MVIDKHRVSPMKGHPDPDAYKRQQVCTGTPMPRSQAISTAAGGHWSTSSRWSGNSQAAEAKAQTLPAQWEVESVLLAISFGRRK